MAGHVAKHNAIGRRRAESAPFALGSTPGATSAYARYIGRVGALAVALGIGAVVVTGNGLGVAHAQDGADATDSQTTDAPSTTETTVDPSSDPTEPGPSANQGPPESGQTLDNPSVPEMNQNSSGGLIESADAAKDGDEEPESVVKDDANPPVDATGDQPPSAPAAPAQQEIVPAAAVNVPQVGGSTTPAGKDPDLTKGSTGGNTLVVSALDETSVDTVQLAAPQTAFGRFALLSEQDPADFATNGQQLKMAAAQDNIGVAAVQEPQQGLLALPVALINFAVTVVNTLLTQLVGDGGPTPPAQPPLLFAILAFVRNEFGRGFFNSSPDAVDDRATTLENTSTSVKIDVLANDSDDDPLTVSDWTNPAHGTLEQNVDGTFTYTPDKNFSGTDKFTYTLSDEDSANFHLLQFDGDGGFTDKATVTITVKEVPTGTVVNDTVVDGYQLASFVKGGEAGGQRDASGNLYVITGNEVRIFDQNNKEIDVRGLPTYPAGTGYGRAWTDVAPGPDGTYIYAVDYRVKLVEREDGENQPQFTTPKKLVLGVDGNYHVDESFKLDKFPYGGQLRDPQGFRIATDNQGNLYVAQGMWVPEGQAFGTVTKYNSNGKYLTQFGQYAENADPGSLRVVEGIAVTPDGKTAYTTEAGNHNERVQRWDWNETQQKYLPTDMWATAVTSGGTVVPNGKLFAPSDIGLDAQGNVYVISSSDAKIVKYDANGNYITHMYMGLNDTPNALTPDAVSHAIAVTARGDAISLETGRMMKLVTPPVV